MFRQNIVRCLSPSDSGIAVHDNVPRRTRVDAQLPAAQTVATVLRSRVIVLTTTTTGLGERNYFFMFTDENVASRFARNSVGASHRVDPPAPPAAGAIGR